MKYTMQDFAKKHMLTLGKHCVYGVFEGYCVHIKYTPIGNQRCLIAVVTHVGEKKKQLEKYLTAKKGELGISNSGVVSIGLMVCPRFTGEVFSAAENILQKLTAHLKKNGFAGADVCPYCGAPLDGQGILSTDSDIPFYTHGRCFESALAAARRKDEEERRKPDRKVLGALGGLLAALFGGVVYLLTCAWWGFGALGSAVGAFASLWLYKKFGGKNTAFAVSFCGAAAFLVSVCALFLGAYYQAYTAQGGWAEAFAFFVNGGKQTVLCWLNAAMIVVFTALGCVYNAFSYARVRRTNEDRTRRL